MSRTPTWRPSGSAPAATSRRARPWRTRCSPPGGFFSALSKGDAIQLITIAEKDLCPAESVPQQVTYVATGSSADVTYGPSGSGYQGTVPLTLTKPLVGNPQFYSMSVQLKAGGTVTCAIKVDG
jgi:hypothetical protein